MLCYRCGTEFPDESDLCPNCGAVASNKEPQLVFSTEASDHQPEQRNMQDYQGLPMNWYKFLINFALFAGGILNILSGSLQIFGLHLGEIVQESYSLFPALKTIDVIYGILIVLLGAYLIYVRFELAGLKKDAPIKLLIAYILNMLLSASYLIVSSFIITSGDLSLLMTEITSNLISILISSGIIIYVNYIYFKKRKILFVN